jgi:hypothetical protein
MSFLAQHMSLLVEQISFGGNLIRNLVDPISFVGNLLREVVIANECLLKIYRFLVLLISIECLGLTSSKRPLHINFGIMCELALSAMLVLQSLQSSIGLAKITGN